MFLNKILKQSSQNLYKNQTRNFIFSSKKKLRRPQAHLATRFKEAQIEVCIQNCITINKTTSLFEKKKYFFCKLFLFFRHLIKRIHGHLKKKLVYLEGFG